MYDLPGGYGDYTKMQNEHDQTECNIKQTNNSDIGSCYMLVMKTKDQ